MRKAATRLIGLLLALGLTLSAFPVRQIAAECLKTHGGGTCPTCVGAKPAPIVSCCQKAKKPTPKPHSCQCQFRAADDANLSQTVSITCASLDFAAVIAARPSAEPSAVVGVEREPAATDSGPPPSPPPRSSPPRGPPSVSE